MQIGRLDPADGVLLSEAYEVECRATSAVRSRWVPLSREARLMSWRADDGWHREFVGGWDGGVLVGFAVALTSHDEPETTWIGVAVDPAYQGRGGGRSLTRAAEESSPATTRRFVASAYRPNVEDLGEFVRGFAEPLGYAVATTETVVELDLAEARPSETRIPAGYDVATYVNGVPDELRPQVGLLKGLVDAEAPSGDLDWRPTPVTPEDYARELAVWQAQGREAIETLAVDGDGQVAAWTCLVASAGTDRAAQIEGTLVLSAHRGNGLGAAVKLDCLRVAAERHPAMRVQTSSDDANVWMRAINETMGFLPVETEALLKRDRDPRQR